MSERYSGVKSVNVACRIMEVFAAQGSQLALKDLAKAAQMPPSKVHRYLASLIDAGFLGKDPNNQRYILGPLAFEIGLRAIAVHDPIKEAIEIQIALRDAIDQTVVLSVWGSKGPTVIRVEDSSQPVVMTMKVGAVLPILGTATGLVFSSFLSPTLIKPLIDKELSLRDHARPIVNDRRALGAATAEVKRQGFSVNKEHLARGVHAIAIPLFGASGDLDAVLAVMAGEEFTETSAKRILKLVHGRSKA